VTLAGDLAGFTVDEPGASVRLLLPSEGADALVVPKWNGNEFLLPDGRRPTIRTLTPLDSHGDGELDVEIVLHGRGAASTWAGGAEPGDPAAVSGPGRGYRIDPEATAFLVGGDETAIPAIGQLLESLPHGTPVDVLVEVARPDGRVPLPEHPDATITWHDLADGAEPGSALVDAVAATETAPGTHVWVAGEAAAVQRIRRDVINGRGVPRPHTSIRGYWKHGRAAGTDDAGEGANPFRDG
jgi:NADPH-dependent ferric siderophore reductase